MPLSPTETRALLGELEHAPNKKLGQNFLVDGNIVTKSITLAEIDSKSKVVEIGPGLGTLTHAITETGAELWAVEHDRTLAEHIRTNLCPEKPNLHLIEGDCLDYPLAQIPSDVVKAGFKIVANLPYAVSTPWMDSVLAGELPQRMVLMLQKEAGDRYAASHGSKTFGAISIFLQSAYTVSGKHLVSAQCFHPAPKVDSVLLQFDLNPSAIRFSSNARNCIRRIFTQRRKQLGSICKRDTEPQAAAWFKSLADQGISATIRPEDLSLKHWQSIVYFI